MWEITPTLILMSYTEFYGIITVLLLILCLYIVIGITVVEQVKRKQRKEFLLSLHHKARQKLQEYELDFYNFHESRKFRLFRRK